VTKLQLVAGASMYTFQGKRNSVEPGYYMFPLIYSDSFSHYIDFRVFEYTPEIKTTVRKLKFGKYIAILEMVVNGEVFREAFGLHSGMELMQLQRIVSDYENSAHTHYL